MILNSYKEKISSKKLYITIELKDTIIDSNAKILYKIINNLISNSIKYCLIGSEIIIKEKNNKLIIFNSTTLIEDDILNNIFEPFVRSQNTKEHGHGLGLYIVANYSLNLGYKVDLRWINNGIEAVLSST